MKLTHFLLASFARSSLSHMEAKLNKIEALIGTDAGGRGMKALISPGDFHRAARTLADLPSDRTVVVLTGFPCCVNHDPPTETDGPPGTLAIARASLCLGHRTIIVAEENNRAVFEAAMRGLVLPSKADPSRLSLELFPANFSDEDENRFQRIAKACGLLISCERAGPGKDGVCYTMRAIDMNAKGLIAPLHRLVQESEAPFIGIGDGGNELGMGKVIDKIRTNINLGDTIGCVIPADHLIAASVSNWGGYALAAGAAVVRGSKDDSIKEWIQQCLPTEQEEVGLLHRCVLAGCRDGVSGKVEATVDGMPLETSMKCLNDIREAALG